MDKHMKIVVLYGGISTEREPSLNGGKAVYDALKESGFDNVELFDFNGKNINKLIEMHPDFVYISLLGYGGEDGSIQGALELAGIKYSGSGIATSAVCMNKVLTKRMLESLKIPTAEYIVTNLREHKNIESMAEYLIKELGVPLIVKAPNQGSSVGVLPAISEKDVIPAIKEAIKYGEQILAEEFLKGKEVTLSILGNDELIVLPETELTSDDIFLSYDVKYDDELMHHFVPARISEEDRTVIRQIGEKIYREFNCRGCARIDFIVDNRKGPMVLEINTLPATTATSAMPASANAAGISFPELVIRIIEYGHEKYVNGDGSNIV